MSLIKRQVKVNGSPDLGQADYQLRDFNAIRNRMGLTSNRVPTQFTTLNKSEFFFFFFSLHPCSAFVESPAAP